MSSSKSLAAWIACAALAGALTGCEVSVEAENNSLAQDTGSQQDTSTEQDTSPDPDTGPDDAGDDDDTGTADAGDTSDAADSGGADGGMTEEEMIARGEYLADHVALCIDCHTPRTQTGQLDQTRLFSGVDCFVDYGGNPDDGVGCVSSQNITSHETGIGKYTDEQVLELLKTGKTNHDGSKKVLFPLMPYWTFANMTDQDLLSIIKYLRTTDPIDNVAAPREPGFGPFAIIDQRTEPAAPIGFEDYPDSTLQEGDEGYEQAQRGKYLVAAAGCVDCHSPRNVPPQDDPNSEWIPADRTQLLEGGATFGGGPNAVTSTNLTPHQTGIWDYTPEEIRIALKVGKDSEDRQMCPPMPGGPDSPYGGMTDEDALAIGWYLTTIPAKDHTNPECNR